MERAKALGLAAFMALMATAFVGVSPATAEEAVLCVADEEPCGESNATEHIHLASVGVDVWLTSVGNILCNVLFLSLSIVGATIVGGGFSYSSCVLDPKTSCAVTEVSEESSLAFLKEGHEIASVSIEGETALKCGLFINCTFNGTGIKGVARGALLSGQETGELSINDQTLNSVSGALCPKTAKLDVTLYPSVSLYIK